MYAGVDVGGTKTLVASLDQNGVIINQTRFATPKSYPDFIEHLRQVVADFPDKDFEAAGVGIPGKIDRQEGVGLDFGHLRWHRVHIQDDLEKIFHCPVAVENDANLGGLSEAMLLPDYRKVLYVTVSTGIGTGVIEDRMIDPATADSEGGHMLIEHHGKMEPWENFASGSALVKKYGLRAADLDDEKAWKQFAHDLSIGFMELIAIIQPDVVVIGGSVGRYFHKFKHFLADYLARGEMPLVKIPPFRAAARPEEAVIYGCYDFARSRYGTN